MPNTEHANQFVVFQNGGGSCRASGRVIDLKLIDVNNRRRERRILTQMAWEFAKLEIPFLIAGDVGMEKSFPATSVSVLEHILGALPLESTPADLRDPCGRRARAETAGNHRCCPHQV